MWLLRTYHSLGRGHLNQLIRTKTDIISAWLHTTGTSRTFTRNSPRREALLLSCYGDNVLSRGYAKVPPTPAVLQQAEQTLTELLMNLGNEHLTNETWVELQDTYRTITGQHRKAMPFDSQIMKILSDLDHLDTAQSLIDYYTTDSSVPSYVAYSHLISICSKRDEVQRLKAAYEAVLSNFKMADARLLTSLIYGFSKSDEWRYCLELLDKVKELSPPTSKNYNPIISASVRNGDNELALSLWEEMISLNQTPSTGVYCAFMDHLSPDSEFGWDMIMRMLQLWKRNLIFPDQFAIETLKTWCESKKSERWTGALTKISQRGVCLSCGSKLQLLELSDSEYDELKPEVWKKVIEGVDAFRTTTPKEMKNFQRFIDSCVPYDIVVDGLNVGYSIPNLNNSEILWQMVKFLSEDCGKKVVVLGRKEMIQNKSIWRPDVMKKINSLARCFYADNISSDDPFILYAALFGGKGTYFVSRDMMRDHKFKLGKPYDSYFQRWQQRNQMVLNKLSNFKPVFWPVFYHETVTQIKDTSIHIPYDDGSMAFSDWKLPLSWFCLQKNR